MYGSDTTRRKPNRKISASGIAMVSVVTWPWLFQTRHFRQFGSASIPYVVHSTIGLLSDSDASYISFNCTWFFCVRFLRLVLSCGCHPSGSNRLNFCLIAVGFWEPAKVLYNRIACVVLYNTRISNLRPFCRWLKSLTFAPASLAAALLHPCLRFPSSWLFLYWTTIDVCKLIHRYLMTLIEHNLPQ